MNEGSTFPIRKIISGGQTGADRASLDFAIAHGIAHGGWCPKGRVALDGALDGKYALVETPRKDYPQRTEWNVRDSEGTVILTLGGKLGRGSKLTVRMAEKHGKPWADFHRGTEGIGERVLAFVRENGITVLNVAGSKETEEGDSVYAFVMEVLEEVWGLGGE